MMINNLKNILGLYIDNKLIVNQLTGEQSVREDFDD